MVEEVHSHERVEAFVAFDRLLKCVSIRQLFESLVEKLGVFYTEVEDVFIVSEFRLVCDCGEFRVLASRVVNGGTNTTAITQRRPLSLRVELLLKVSDLLVFVVSASSQFFELHLGRFVDQLKALNFLVEETIVFLFDFNLKFEQVLRLFQFGSELAFFLSKTFKFFLNALFGSQILVDSSAFEESKICPRRATHLAHSQVSHELRILAAVFSGQTSKRVFLSWALVGSSSFFVLFARLFVLALQMSHGPLQTGKFVLLALHLGRPLLFLRL